MPENDAAVAARNAVCADAFEEGMCVLSCYLELGEGRQVHEAHALAHSQRFFLHCRPPVRAFEGKVLTLARLVVPARPLPAEDLAELSTLRPEPLVDGGRSQIPPNLMLLSRRQAPIHVLVFVHRDPGSIFLVRPVPETPRVELAHIDLRLAVHHPLRQIFAGPSTLADADRGAAMHPVV